MITYEAHELMADMDALTREFKRHGKTPDHELLAAIGTDIVAKWAELREVLEGSNV
jgi:hypothetical protein